MEKLKCLKNEIEKKTNLRKLKELLLLLKVKRNGMVMHPQEDIFEFQSDL